MKEKVAGTITVLLVVVLLAILLSAPPVSSSPGYIFTAPSAIDLGSAKPGEIVTGSSTGHLTGDDASGYTVTGVDAKKPHKGYMSISATQRLHNKLQIGPSAAELGSAGVAQTFLDTTGITTDEDVPLYVSQLVAYNDDIATDYSLTIEFTITVK